MLQQTNLDELRSMFVEHMPGVPGAVAILATAADGNRTGLAAPAWNSLCAEPPILIACINRNATGNPMIQRAGAFGVSI